MKEEMLQLTGFLWSEDQTLTTDNDVYCGRSRTPESDFVPVG